MDLDIGNLIYIIATIVALLAGVFGKKKKPGQSKGAKSKSSVMGFLENLNQEFKTELSKSTAQESEEEVYEEELLVEPVPRVETEVLKEEPIYSPFGNFEGLLNPNAERNKNLMDSEAIRSTDNTEALEVLELDESPNGVDYHEVIEDFDLGTAVIYSTIINRQEY